MTYSPSFPRSPTKSCLHGAGLWRTAGVPLWNPPPQLLKHFLLSRGERTLLWAWKGRPGLGLTQKCVFGSSLGSDALCALAGLSPSTENSLFGSCSSVAGGGRDVERGLNLREAAWTHWQGPVAWEPAGKGRAENRGRLRSRDSRGCP